VARGPWLVATAGRATAGHAPLCATAATTLARRVQWADRLTWPVCEGGLLTDGPYVLQPIGWVESPLVDRDMAPKQGDEGSPDAWLVFDHRVRNGLRDLQAGTEVIVLTWLDRASRDVLVVHPRGDPTRPETGVFSTRSPDRPNPIGLHRVAIRSIDGTRVSVSNLEALDGTPVLDVKPVLDSGTER
jgi:tRNA-Thr(GGU) m(6)t(6)A37 methyltransferase TsaA